MDIGPHGVVRLVVLKLKAVLFGNRLGINCPAGPGFDRDRLALEILHRLDRAILGDGHHNSRVVVRLGEINRGLPFIGHTHPTHGSINLPGLQGRQGRIKAHHLEVILEAFVLGNLLKHFNFDPRVFPRISPLVVGNFKGFKTIHGPNRIGWFSRVDRLGVAHPHSNSDGNRQSHQHVSQPMFAHFAPRSFT